MKAPLPNQRHALLELGSDAHYFDTAYYSTTYADRTEDVAYYLAVAQQHGGPVLEYGCGGGRITLPLARAGHEVTGIDRSRPMLKQLRAALADEDPAVRKRLCAKSGDMRTVKLDRRFSLVLCTFNTLLHLYTRRDIERFLARVRAHITRRGHFVFDTSLPDPEELARDPTRRFRTPRFRHPSSGEVVRYSERFSYEALSQVLTVDMLFEPRDEPEATWVTPLCHRQFFPQELEALLHYNGFRLRDVVADFDRDEVPNNDSTSLVYHCTPR